ncbi:MAG: hypothetical protein Q4F30_03425, partial [Akkermansia sp.]|nr:hypothetical protein [Akkermansia sp.]
VVIPDQGRSSLGIVDIGRKRMSSTQASHGMIAFICLRNFSRRVTLLRPDFSMSLKESCFSIFALPCEILSLAEEFDYTKIRSPGINQRFPNSPTIRRVRIDAAA